jgi:hypothetical protein
MRAERDLIYESIKILIIHALRNYSEEPIACIYLDFAIKVYDLKDISCEVVANYFFIPVDDRLNGLRV